MPLTAVYNKITMNWLRLLTPPILISFGPRGSRNQFTTFYLFLLWIDTCPRVLNYVCIWADPAVTGSGDHDENEAALERANPADADARARRGVARRRPGYPERVALE